MDQISAAAAAEPDRSKPNESGLSSCFEAVNFQFFGADENFALLKIVDLNQTDPGCAAISGNDCGITAVGKRRDDDRLAVIGGGKSGRLNFLVPVIIAVDDDGPIIVSRNFCSVAVAKRDLRVIQNVNYPEILQGRSERPN
jgi:hypothetical protein